MPTHPADTSVSNVANISSFATRFAHRRWIHFQDWWAFEKDARRAFCLREMMHAAKNKEIQKAAADDGIIVMDGDWLSTHPSQYNQETHQFDNVVNEEMWVRWKAFCLWYRGFDGTVEASDSESESDDEESESDKDEEEEVEEKGEPDETRAAALSPVQESVSPAASPVSVTIPSPKALPSFNPPRSSPLPAPTLAPVPVPVVAPKPVAAASADVTIKPEPKVAKPPPFLDANDVHVATPMPPAISKEKVTLITNASEPVSDVAHKVTTTASAVSTVVEENESEKQPEPEAVLKAPVPETHVEEEKEEAALPPAKPDPKPQAVEPTPDLMVIEHVPEAVTSVLKDTTATTVSGHDDDVRPRENSGVSLTSVFSASVKSLDTLQGSEEDISVAKKEDVAAEERVPEEDNNSEEKSSKKNDPSLAGSMKAASTASKMNKKLKKKRSKRAEKEKEKERKAKEKKALFKKKAQMSVRAKFLGGKTAAIDKAVDKVSDMINVTNDFEEREKGLKPKLRGIALLRAKTKALMMAKKLEQLKGNLMKSSNVSSATAEDLADVDLFEEVDMSKFEPDPEDARPKTPPPPALPFFTLWKGMSEEERIAELSLACMDPDVLRLAITSSFMPPDLEDRNSLADKRKKNWDAFRLWYSDNEEVQAPLEKDKDGKDLPRKVSPKVAEARKVFGRNEAKAAMTDAAVKKAYGKDIEGSDPSIGFRNWYNSSKSVRREFLTRAARRLEIMRRATVSLRTYNLPEAPLFQEVLDPLRDGAPPVEERIRLYSSRYPEMFTWEEVLEWDLMLDDDDNAFVRSEAIAVNERRRLKLLESEQEREKLETDICMWEDHRSHLMRVAMNEMKAENLVRWSSSEEILNEEFAYFAEIPKEKETYEKMNDLKYDQGTGLDNQDEFSDGRERAKAEAAARARRREERERQEANEAKRKHEEEKKRKIEAERARRLRETARERERIIKELADIKEGRKLAKIRAEEDKIAAEKAAEELKKRHVEMAEAERSAKMKKQQAQDDAKAWQQQRAKEMEVNRESEERVLMGAEDELSAVEGAKWMKHVEEVRLRRDLLEFAYLAPSDYVEDDDYAAHLLWSGPETYKTKTRRKHTDAYSMPSGEWVLEDPDEMGTFDMSRSMSNQFLSMMKVPGSALNKRQSRSGGGAGGVRAARTLIRSKNGTRPSTTAGRVTTSVPTSPIAKRKTTKMPPVSPPTDFKLVTAVTGTNAVALSPLEGERPRTVGGSPSTPSPMKKKAEKNVVILSPSARIIMKNKKILERKMRQQQLEHTPFLRTDLHSVSGATAKINQSYSYFDQSIGRMVEKKL